MLPERSSFAEAMLAIPLTKTTCTISGDLKTNGLLRPWPHWNSSSPFMFAKALSDDGQGR